MKSIPLNRFIVIGVIVILALVIGSLAARTEQMGARAAFNQLQSRAAGTLDAHWNDTTHTPDFIAGISPDARIPYTPSAAERGNPAAIARGFLDENRALFRLKSATEELAFLRNEDDPQLGYSNIRMAQTYQGIPVYGKQLVVHIDSQERIVAVNGHFTPDIQVATKPSITAENAEQVALNNLLNEQLEPSERATVATEILRDQTQLQVYVDANGKATLTWFIIIETDSPLGEWYYFVNAGRPVVTHRYDNGEHIKQRRTFTADNKTSIPGRVLIEEGEKSTKDAVAQAAHDGAGKVYDYFFSTFKRDSIDGRGSQMISTVHYGSSTDDAENAAWIGQKQQMIYGDGGKVFKPLPYGLDVIGHEFTHGVTDATSNLNYEGQSGALNESYSDVFAAMIDRTNWTIGEQVIKSPPFPTAVLRSLEDPGLGGRYDVKHPMDDVGQPSHMREFANLSNSRKNDNGGVHVNSGIPNKAAFLVAKAIGKEKTEQIYYRTLTQYLEPESNFGDAARATVRAAQDLYGTNEANAVRDAFNQVGISVTGSTAQTPAQPTPVPSKGQNVPPPPSTNLPAGCVNVIVNGSFENENAGWVEVTSQHSAIIDTELPHTGSRSAWLGGTDQEPIAAIYQDVNIPANATSVKLGFWRFLHEETSGVMGILASDAKFSAVIAKDNGDVLQALESVLSTDGDDEWQQKQFDLGQYAGKKIRLGFASENPKNNISSYFVDDVELIVCTTGSGSNVPQPSKTGNVYVQGYAKNADTGRGIEGAQVFIIKPGLSATQAAADDTITTSEVIATAVSDANGLFRTDVAIPVGKTYSVIVIAGGYRPIVADDGMQIPANAANPYSIDAKLRPSR
jgi:bacillolysin